MSEIDDRIHFLNEMEKYGLKRKYEFEITNEISHKVKQLEQLARKLRPDFSSSPSSADEWKTTPYFATYCAKISKQTNILELEPEREFVSRRFDFPPWRHFGLISEASMLRRRDDDVIDSISTQRMPFLRVRNVFLVARRRVGVIR